MFSGGEAKERAIGKPKGKHDLHSPGCPASNTGNHKRGDRGSSALQTEKQTAEEWIEQQRYGLDFYHSRNIIQVKDALEAVRLAREEERNKASIHALENGVPILLVEQYIEAARVETAKEIFADISASRHGGHLFDLESYEKIRSRFLGEKK